ncbi:MAG: hypothetical protein ACKVQK_14110 [Burkholderiales bacterium]
MSHTVNARITPHLEQKIAEYCVKRGVTRSETVVRALKQYLDESPDGVSAWSLAADLVPEHGVEAIQSDNASALARKAMRGKAPR